MLGAVVLLGGYLDTGENLGPRATVAAVTLGTAVAVVFTRRAPVVALAVMWVVGAVHVSAGMLPINVEVWVLVVIFGASRWGSRPVVVLGALSSGAVVLAALRPPLTDVDRMAAIWRIVTEPAVWYVVTEPDQAPSGLPTNDVFQFALSFRVIAMVSAAWLGGIVVRSVEQARQSRASQAVAEAEAARVQQEAAHLLEIARLRETQARLSNDVHDVVGHTLAVILAQTESAQYLPDSDVQDLKRMMRTIADSTRMSLREVRRVLRSVSDRPVSGPPGSLDRLVDGVRASGREVQLTEVGSPRPLPPGLDVVAFHVLQEMLTNAVKYGRRDTPIMVERRWAAELRIEVSNVIGTRPGPGGTPPLGGQGIEGMRRRLASVGGRFDIRHEEEPDGTYTVTAWVPARDAA